MKYLRKYNESAKKFTVYDIADILIDISDSNEVAIYSANGFGYHVDDLHSRDCENEFQFHRYSDSTKRRFKLQIGFKRNKNYNELVDFLDEMKVPIGRLKDEGFYVTKMQHNINNESDVFSCYEVIFNFESN